jgi:hypothetical protein
MSKRLILEWGLDRNVDGADVEAAWGARAIWNRGFIDLLWDRQDIKGTDEGRAILVSWINETGLKEIDRKLKDKNVYQSSQETVMQDTTYKGRKFSIVASPNASHGYLYLTARVYKENP